MESRNEARASVIKAVIHLCEVYKKYAREFVFEEVKDDELDDEKKEILVKYFTNKLVKKHLHDLEKIFEIKEWF